MGYSNVIIRSMNREDVELAVSWAAKEGWNPGLYDADCFYSADPNGFFVAEIHGVPAGCISAVAYDDAFGFIGFYMVTPELRGHGIGMQLWQAAMEYLGQRVIGADGVVAMLDKYGLSGFRTAHNNARYEGVGKPSPIKLTNLAHVPFQELEQYDSRFFPAGRSGFLKCWISRPGTHSLAVMDGNQLTGYGVIRPCHRGFKIAPLFAHTPEIADELFAGLSSLVAGQPLFLDIPVCNTAAQALVEKNGMELVFETARIYRGTEPALPLDRIYGITSFELG